MISGSTNSEDLKIYDFRLDASYHLSSGIVSKHLIQNNPYSFEVLGKLTDNIFYGGRARRIYVKEKEKGVPFVGISHMLGNDFSSVKYISKKHTPNLADSFVKKGWTLVSRSGTIGNTVYVNDDFNKVAASEDIIRIVPNASIYSGFLYAFLSTKHGYALMTQGSFGAVVQHIEPDFLYDLPIPIFPETLQKKIHNLINEASDLRVNANEIIVKAQSQLKMGAKLNDLSHDEYEYFGPCSQERKTSVYTINRRKISSTSINAFNYSKRVEEFTQRININNSTKTLDSVLDEKKIFTTGSFPRVEINSPKSILLINQQDIFNIKIKGKLIARKKVKTHNLVENGEVLIAGVGTLGENETFCRVIYAGEGLQGKLVSGEFLRLRTNKDLPSGYLFAWLSTDYGFRLIRRTQTGTKLCRPIQELLLQIPIPILGKKIMQSIDEQIQSAFRKRYLASQKENEAISIIEKEFESWQN